MMNSRRGAPLKQTFAPVAAAPQRAATPVTPGKAPEGRVIASLFFRFPSSSVFPKGKD